MFTVFDSHSNCLAFLDNAGSGKGKKELQSIASQLNRDKKVFLESLHNIRSNSDCSSKMHSTGTDSTVNKTFEGVISTSDSFTKRPPKEHAKESRYLTVVHNDSASVGGNDVKGCFVNFMAKDVHSANSRSHLCLQCFPNVEDKAEFKSFVEELFKGTVHI